MCICQPEANGAREPLVEAQGTPTLQPENSPASTCSLGEAEVPPKFQDEQTKAPALCEQTALAGWPGAGGRVRETPCVLHREVRPGC